MNSNQIRHLIEETINDYNLKKIDLPVFIGIMRSYYGVIDTMREVRDGRSTNRAILKNYIDRYIETAKTLDGTWESDIAEKCCKTCKRSYEVCNEGLTGCNVKAGRLLDSNRMCYNWCEK